MEDIQSPTISMLSLSDRWRKLETSFSTVEISMADRLKELELKEKEITEAAKRVENSQIDAELREIFLAEKLKQVELKEEEMNAKIEGLELKAKKIEEICNGMVLKRRELVEIKANLMDEMKVKEDAINERLRAVEVREKEMDERCKALDFREQEIDEKSKNVELKFKQIDESCQSLELNVGLKSQELKTEPSSDFPTCAQLKDEEPQPEASSEIEVLCRDMDAECVRSYLIEHFKDSSILLKMFSDSLQLAPDPAKFVLDVIQRFYEFLDSDNVSKQICILSCIVLPAKLLKLKANITPHLKDDAWKFSIMWKDSLAKRGTTPPEIYGFLRFLASYKLAQSYDADELLSLLGALYTESEVLWPERDSYLCRLLGLEKKIPGIIQSLIMSREKLRAVVYICAFRMENIFPPVPLLKSYLERIKNRAEEMVKKGNDTDQNEAVNMELSALKSLLKCISNFKLESCFPPAPLELRIKQLEVEREGNLKAESLQTVKKNLLKSVKKEDDNPSSGRSHSGSRKKHSISTSRESPKQAKRSKVLLYACPKSISKNPRRT